MKYIVTDTELTDVADAIREKSGSSNQMSWPAEYISAIDAIDGSGEETKPVSVTSKDVDFYDYDGTRLYSYTKNEFLQLSQLPPNPDHSNDEIPLRSDGWNWTLEDIQEQLEETSYCPVGQLYRTVDGQNRVCLYVDNLEPNPVKIRSYGDDKGVVIDWGDGTDIETWEKTSTSSAATIYVSHTYSGTGRYELKTLNGNFISFNPEDQSYNPATRFAEKVYMMSGTWQGRMYMYCSSLESIVVPSFANQRIRAYVLSHCGSLRYIAFPSLNDTTIKTFEANAFDEDPNLFCVSFGPRLWIIPAYTFRNCYSLEKFCIPLAVASIGTYSFYGCCGLKRMDIPKNVTSIGNYAFYNCKGITEYHLRPETPPTLGGTSVFSGLNSNCIFYVPYSEDHSILNAYKTATRWSTYASKMQEEPQ